jgi:hypothetical protein
LAVGQEFGATDVFAARWTCGQPPQVMRADKTRQARFFDVLMADRSGWSAISRSADRLTDGKGGRSVE